MPDAPSLKQVVITVAFIAILLKKKRVPEPLVILLAGVAGLIIRG